MNTKKIVGMTVLIIMMVSLNLSTNSPRTVFSWGIPTHYYTVEVAAQLVPDEWKEAFSYYMPEVTSGSSYPDLVLQDWDNHLYYPISQEHNAPWKINETVYVIRSYAEENDWELVFFFLGIISHYTADINIPVHTDEYWDGHPAYESDINNHLDELNVTVHDFGNITDPVDFIIDCATYAHQYYWDIRNAYPTGNEKDVVVTNSTIKQITEEQLGRAIGAILAIWRFTLEPLTPPEIQEIEDVATILVDRYHNNDYAADTLNSFVSTLDRDIVKVSFIDKEITALDLAGVDMLVITAPMGSATFNESELNAISDWFNAGGKLLLSSRGDYNDVNFEAINALLEAIGAKLRVNDDNVYTNSNDPDYYKDWYCNTDEFGTDPVAEAITGNLTRKIQFFSPSSIYSIEDSEDVHWLVFGEEYFYQRDNNPPGPTVIFDNTNDNVGGTSIPLAAVETTANSSLALFGTTIWSDYDFSLTNRDNKYLAFNTIEYLLNIDLISNDDYQPANETTTETSTTETSTTETSTTETSATTSKQSPYPILVFNLTILLAAILPKLVRIRQRKLA